MTTAKNGLSAKTLSLTLGTSYRTAWSMLHRYRIAMVRSEREKLSGFVEIDESLVGGVDHGGKRGRGSDKAIVVMAVEIKEPKGYGRIRMRHIPNASGDSLVPFVCDVVSSGATIHTDGWNGYNDLEQKGYVHQKKIISASADSAHVMFLCLAYTGLRVCSNVGFSVHIRGRLELNIYNRIWKNLLFDLTGQHHKVVYWFFGDYLNRQLLLTQ